MINLSYIGRKELFPSRKETYSTLSTLFYQFYPNLELSERIKGLSKFATKNCGSLLEYVLSILDQLPYYIIIIFLTVFIYPPTINSREQPLLKDVSELFQLLFSHK